MRLVTFQKESVVRMGALVNDHVIDLAGAQAARNAGDALPASVLGLLRAGQNAMDEARASVAYAAENLSGLVAGGQAFPESEIAYLPPVLYSGKMVCLRLNYREHLAESDVEQPQYPLTFAKFTTSLVGHRQPIQFPALSPTLDFEGELAVVMGRDASNVSAGEAIDYVAGYTVFNDVTVREYQLRKAQFMQGKNFDRSSPLGPTLVTADEVSDPHALDIRVTLNGTVMQDSNTSDFIFDIPSVIEYLSQMMTLEPGDVIATGTPPGTGFVRDPQVFLKPGDVLRTEIAEIGVLENQVA